MCLESALCEMCISYIPHQGLAVFVPKVFFLGRQSTLVFCERPGNYGDLNSVLMLPILEIQPQMKDA